MSVADQAARAATALLQTLALADADEAYEAFVGLLRDELAAAKREGFQEASALSDGGRD